MREGKPRQQEEQEGMTEPQSEVHSALEKFYKGHGKTPEEYVYTDSGDLVAYAVAKKRGASIGERGKETLRITLPNYRPLTNEERNTQELERKTSIVAAEAVFEAARRELRDLLQRRKEVIGAEDGNEGDADELTEEILLKNMEVQEADYALQAIRYPLRMLEEWPRVYRPFLFIDDSREDRKVPMVNVFRTRPFTLQATYVRIAEGEGAGVTGTTGEKKKRSRATATTAPAGEIVRVRVVQPALEKNINAFLNPWYPAPITFKGQGYRHAYQATMASVAEELGDAEAAARIMAAATPEEMTYKPKEGTAAETYAQLLSNALFATLQAKFKQNPELGVRLLQTGTDRVVIVPPGDALDTLLGTGLDIASPNIKNPTKWTGQNRIGFYIEQVREDLQAARTAEKTAMAAAMEEAGAGAGAGADAGAIVMDTAAAAVAATTEAVSDVAGAVADAVADAFGVGEDAEADADADADAEADAVADA